MSRFTLVKGNKSPENKHADRQILKHRIKKVLRIVALAAALVFFIWFIHRIYQNTTFNDYEIISKTMRQDSDTSEYLAYNGHILKLSRDGAEAFEGSGKAIWNITYRFLHRLQSSFLYTLGW